MKEGSAPRKPAKWHLSPSEKFSALTWQARGDQHQNRSITGEIFSKPWSDPHIASMPWPGRASGVSHPHLKQREGDGKSEEWPLENGTTWTRPWECKSIHVSLTEKACRSPTLFSDVSASKRTTLRVSIRSEADSKGSKGAVTSPSRTTDKSQEGTAVGRTGLRRLAPRMKAETIRCLPKGISSSSLRAAMAAT